MKIFSFLAQVISENKHIEWR